MAQYTTEVRTICEIYAGLDSSAGNASVNDVIRKSYPKVFDFDYPIFDPEYKAVLEPKILRHFYSREIAMETVGLWKLRLENKLNEIMPYYNQLYKSQLLDFNPFWDVDLTKTYSKQADGTTTNNTLSHNVASDSGESKQNTTTAGNEKTAGTTKLTGSETDNTTDNTTTNKTDTTDMTQLETRNLLSTENGSLNQTDNGTETSTGGYTKTTNGTVDKTGTEKTEVDSTVTTNNKSNSGGTSGGTTTTTNSGSDRTTGNSNTTTNNTKTGDSTETRDLKTDLDKIGNVENRFSDTPQNTIENLKDGSYLTSANYQLNSGRDVTEETGTVEKDFSETDRGSSDTDSSSTTTYGRKTIEESTGTFSQNATGNGTQVTDGETLTTRNLKDTSSGTEKLDNDGTITKNNQRTATDEKRRNDGGTVKTDTDGTVTTEGREERDTKSQRDTDTTESIDNKRDTTSTTEGTTNTYNVTDSTGTVNANSKIQNIEQYLETVRGRNGGRSAAQTLLEYRQTFLNIDMQVIRELNDLFFTLW